MEINILHVLPEKTKIKTSPELISKIFSGKTLSEWSIYFNIPLKNLSRYRNCSRSMPLYLFMKLVDNSRLSLNSFQNKLFVKINNNGDYIKIGPMLKIEADWIYVASLLKGDGHITSNFWYINFINNNRKLINFVIKFFIDIGIPKRQIYSHNRGNVVFLTIRSYPLAYIFYKLLDVPIGRKMEINIKDFVISNRKFSIAEIRGAFDTEGCVSFTGSRRISITSTSKNWINKLIIILNNIGIKASIFEEKGDRKRTIYRILIHHIINLERFYNIIQPLHDKRSKKLNQIIESYKKNPVGIFRKKNIICNPEWEKEKEEYCFIFEHKIIYCT